MKHILPACLALIFGLTLWQGIVWVTGVPHFILPGPMRVAAALRDNAALLGAQAGVTLANLAMGLSAGIALGVASALNLAMSPAARLLLRPLMVFAQAVPVFALAPIVTLWLGYGAPSKVVMVALVTYFPVTSAFFDGLMRLPADLVLLARHIRPRTLPLLHALPALGSGLRLAAVQAPFAVIIAEWVGASKGLGHLMLLSNGRAQTDLMFAALFLLAGISLCLFLAADRLARHWDR
ncbi:MAG: ABC transporter permease subunit [Paracoccaceae bacterium]|nr:ABC transporter permease subunit [Paracoccaceae bacterium]